MTASIDKSFTFLYYLQAAQHSGTRQQPVALRKFELGEIYVVCYALTMLKPLSRRQFLKIGGHITAGATLLNSKSSFARSSLSALSSGSAALSHSDLLNTSVVALVEAIRTRKISSVELVNAYLNRIEEVNPWLNAVVLTTVESALEGARNADAVELCLVI